jgi:hypothetical protein
MPESPLTHISMVLVVSQTCCFILDCFCEYIFTSTNHCFFIVYSAVNCLWNTFTSDVMVFISESGILYLSCQFDVLSFPSSSSEMRHIIIIPAFMHLFTNSTVCVNPRPNSLTGPCSH